MQPENSKRLKVVVPGITQPGWPVVKIQSVLIGEPTDTRVGNVSGVRVGER